MKFKTLMVIKAVVCLGFGPCLLLFPDPLLTMIGQLIRARSRYHC